MKAKLPRIIAGVVLAAALSAGTAQAAPKRPVIAQDSRINVQFVEPDRFTDIRDSYTGGTDSHQQWVLEEVRKFLQQRGERTLREDLHLVVRITDIDLAGDFEPWRFRHHDDIRIVKEIYPTRIRLEFQLIDSAGNILAEGERKLSDFGRIPTFTMSSDTLRFEKEVLRDWLAREFREYRRT